MICFVSVSTFRKRIVELLKVKRGVYGGVTNEICQAFKDATIEQRSEEHTSELQSR